MEFPDSLANQVIAESALASPQALYEAYSTNQIIGCAVDAEGMPDDVRKYARYEEDQVKAELGEMYEFSAAAPGNLYMDWDDKLCVPFAHYIQQDRRKAMKGRQLTGDCVSWAKRTMIDHARCFEIGSLRELETYVLRGATALLYSCRGHTGAGASPERIANAATKVGILLEKVYTSPDGEKWDFTDYDSYYKLGMR